MISSIVCRGTRFCVEAAVCLDASCPARRFLDSLSPRDRARLISLFVRLADEGRVANREQFKKVEGSDYFEFKLFQIRMLCRFQPGGRLVLLNGFVKKTERIRPQELARAARIFSEHMEAQERE